MAREHGHPVKETGRLSPTVLAAWPASGAPAVATLDLPSSDPPRDAGKHRVASAYALLRSVFNTAHRDGLIAANPFALPGAAAVRPPERPNTSPEEVAEPAELMPPLHADAVIVAVWAGLRGVELFASTRAHVNVDRGTLRVELALVEVTGQPVRFGLRPIGDGHLAAHRAPAQARGRHPG